MWKSRRARLQQVIPAGCLYELQYFITKIRRRSFWKIIFQPCGESLSVSAHETGYGIGRGPQGSSSAMSMTSEGHAKVRFGVLKTFSGRCFMNSNIPVSRHWCSPNGLNSPWRGLQKIFVPFFDKPPGSKPSRRIFRRSAEIQAMPRFGKAERNVVSQTVILQKQEHIMIVCPVCIQRRTPSQNLFQAPFGQNCLETLFLPDYVCKGVLVDEASVFLKLSHEGQLVLSSGVCVIWPVLRIPLIKKKWKRMIIGFP